ncbi:hypothetical protein L5515_005815 [Caenorhabditis briggsae]|uniref:Uncharacterized protein n=1 Tax=Caenorhabditis briggsae TaxID=6238 RepID=A0AAE9EYX8_CAEBR|nr:hypothetical protein L5515_005815 [Caenorhabditis briggsae]
MEITLKLFLHLIQYAGFLFGQITNATLLFLVLTRAEKLFGSYRNVMDAFASYSLGSMFIVMMDGPIKMEVWMGNILAPLYCGSSAVCISLLTIQFYYRYIALCKPQILERLRGWKLYLLFVPCFICFAAWFSLVHYGMHNTSEKEHFMRKAMAEIYGVDLHNSSFIGPMYYSHDNDGLCTWRCAKTRDLNSQLFKTLSFQTIVPLIMMYGPVGAFITLPFLEIEVGTLGNYVGASAGAYPAIEPLIAIYFIKDFRNAVLCRQKRTGAKLNYISNNSQTRNSDIFSNSFH